MFHNFDAAIPQAAIEWLETQQNSDGPGARATACIARVLALQTPIKPLTLARAKQTYTNSPTLTRLLLKLKNPRATKAVRTLAQLAQTDRDGLRWHPPGPTPFSMNARTVVAPVRFEIVPKIEKAAR